MIVKISFVNSNPSVVLRQNAPIYVKVQFGPSASGVAWGGITGTLSSQVDLQAALDAKANSAALTNYVATSVSSQFLTSQSLQTQGTFNTTQLQDYRATSLNSQLLFTSQSSLFQPVGNYLTTAMQSGASTQFVQANAGFAGTNISGTIASNGLSLSVAPGGGAGDGYNILAAGTQTAGSAQTVVFSNANNVTFGLSNSSVMTASASFSQSVQTQGTFNTTQLGDYRATSLNSQLLFTSQSSLFALTANDSLSLGTAYTTHTHSQYLNTSQSTAFQSTGNYLTTQSAQAFSASGGSSTFQTLAFANSNGLTFSNSNGSVIGSYTVPTQSVQTHGTFDTNQLTNYLGTGYTTHTHSQYVNTSQSSLFLQTQSNQAVSGSNGSFTFQTLSFGNLNGMSFYTSNGSVVASYTDAGAGGGISAVNFSAGTTSTNATNVVFSNANNITFGLNGATVTASCSQPNITLSGWNPYQDLNMVAGQLGAGTVQIDPMRPTEAVQFDRLAFPIINTNSSNSSGSHTISVYVGVYTRNASTLSLLGSTSASTALTHSGTQGSYSLYSGIRLWTIGSTSTFTQGDYWLAFMSRTTSGGANGSYSQLVGSNVNSVFAGFFGQAHTTTQQFTLGQGILSATSSALPNAIAFSDIRGSDSGALRPAIVMFASSTV